MNKPKPLLSDLNDRSVGVEDFSDWSYFKKRRPKPILIGHSSQHSESVLEKTKLHATYNMAPHSMTKQKPKTEKELRDEATATSDRARAQLAKWRASNPMKPTGKIRQMSINSSVMTTLFK